MRKAVLGVYSLLIVGTVTLAIFPPPPLAPQAASAPEHPKEITVKNRILTLEAPASLRPLNLERESYSATTIEEVEELQSARAAEQLAAEAAAAEAEAAKAAETLRGSARPQATASAPRYDGGGSPAEWMAAAGIAEEDWGYVDFIVSKESGWNPNAVNSSSGASGLVQALPCGKVPGNCFDPIDNLRWANGYAEGRYGSWAGAYDFWIVNHWW